FIRNPSPSNLSCNRATENPVNVSGTKVWVKIDDVVAVEGPRLPDASTAQKDFRMAFVLVVPNGVRPTAYELARLDSIRAQWAAYFKTAVENLGTMNSGLPSPGPFEIVSDTLVKGAVGGNYRDQVFAVGGQLPYVSFALTGGSLPPGLSLNTATGVVSGIPLMAGGYDFTVQVCDSIGTCVARQLHIDVFTAGIGTVVINEVELTSRGGSVELYNKGPQAQNIGNWTVETRTLSTLATLTISAGTIIPPGCYFVLNEYTGTNTANYLYFNTAIPWTNAASGSCTLKDNLGNGVDFCRWGGSAQAPPAGTGWSSVNPASPAGSRNLGRDGLSTDTDNSSDFTSQVGTLSRQNLPYTSSLQTAAVGTPTIQALITNWNNIAARGTFPTLSYVDDGTTFLLDASFFAGALKPNGDTVVYRSFFSDQQFLPVGPLDIDSSDPRATHIR
ncbi:MAG TPA: lamin tail domain-containing protein, partial [candidate division Zixibacteria bacterium]|nr:lamin tail domain-containing protein [candidate division Zixibacteria bacterium]